MYRRILLGLALAGVIVGIRTLLVPRQPDSELIRLAVRATLHAMPTATPRIVEVTRAVEVTSIPVTIASGTAPATDMPLQTVTPAPSFTPTSLLTPEPAPPTVIPVQPVAQAASVESDSSETSHVDSCPNSSTRSYSLIPVTGPTIEHPDQLHGDLNLGLRGYVPTSVAPGLVDIPGPTDSDPPQLSAVMPDNAAIALARSYRVHNWNWGCGEHGCQGGELGGVEVSMVGIAATPGMQVSIPSRRAQIYGGGYVALIVFADTTRLTLVYTREDSVANGYAVHLEHVCVDPALLSAYRAANQSGRSTLPGVRSGEVIGVASGEEIAVAVRDRGRFADPRSRKDWWQSGN